MDPNNVTFASGARTREPVTSRSGNSAETFDANGINRGAYNVASVTATSAVADNTWNGPIRVGRAKSPNDSVAVKEPVGGTVDVHVKYDTMNTHGTVLV